MPIAKSNGAVASAPVIGQAAIQPGSTLQTAPAPVAASLGKRVLDTPKVEENRKEYKGRDFDAEARGKVACVAFNAALASPGLAMFTYANLDEYLVAVRKAADASVAYTWEKQK